MKSFKILSALLLLFTAGALAQKNSFPEAFEISTDTATYITLPDHTWQYFKEDKELSLASVLLPGNLMKFTSKRKPEMEHGFYWMRYRIKNKLNRPLSITVPEDLYGEIHISTNGGRWKKYITGKMVPWSRRDGLKLLLQAVHTIPANGEIKVFERCELRGGSSLQGLIGIRDNVISESYFENDERNTHTVVSSFFMGFLFFAACFNFFFYYVNRKKVYLIYGATLFTVAIDYSELLFIALREHPFLFSILYLFILILFSCLLALTLVMFLGVRQNHPRAYKVLMAAIMVLALSMTLNSVVQTMDILPGLTSVISDIVSGVILFIVISAFIIIIADLYKGRHSAKLFIVAVLPFLGCMCYAYLSSPPPKYFYIVFILATMWTVLTLSWSLFSRFRKVQEENVQQAVEKERILKEQEKERNMLIAGQNEVLEQQVAERTSELTRSLTELRQTQNQLIQSEKMASLGELTAGIAHEIQNPLNFVNNFSDVSVELLQELKEEAGKGDLEEVKAIADDVAQNLEKIAYHGRRADSIVKGMLQHSRTSSGQKEQTGINALADEYLRLTYHGLRAKDKFFNAELVTNFDEDLPKANIVPQDIGRVLLNLFSNAFYATQEKGRQLQSADYKPRVTVTTRQKDNSIEISVKDNGTGMPEAIKDKILQPFFTTKPTGQGTGLGLSLSYDIVVKGHGGHIDIESKEGEGSEFIILLPVY